jgi:hypothetical protein
MLVVFSGYYGFSSINKTDRHDITEILLKVALNTIALTLTHQLTSRIEIVPVYTIVQQWFECCVMA